MPDRKGNGVELKRLGSVTELIAASSAVSLLVSILFQSSYLISIGWPQAVGHLSIGDYVDGSIVAIAALAAVLLIAALASLVPWNPLRHAGFSFFSEVLFVISGLISTATGIYAAYTGLLEYLGLAILGLTLVSLGGMMIYVRRHSRRRRKTSGDESAVETDLFHFPSRGFLGVMFAASCIMAAGVGAIAGDVRSRCPAMVLIVDKEGGQLAGRLVMRLQKEVLMTPVKQSRTLLGVPWDTISIYGVRDCTSAPPAPDDLRFENKKQAVDSSNITPPHSK